MPKEERTYPCRFAADVIRNARDHIVSVTRSEWNDAVQIKSERRVRVNPDRSLFPESDEEFFDTLRTQVGSGYEFRSVWSGNAENQLASLTVISLSTSPGTYVTLRYPEPDILAAVFEIFARAVASPSAAVQADDLILAKFRSVGAADATRCYEQALRDIAAGERLSWRGPANELREALRETLEHFAPKAEVEAAPGFKRQPDTSGPTMKQRTIYAMRKHAGSSAAKVAGDQAATIEALLGDFFRSAYDHGSNSAHTHAGEDEFHRVHRHVRSLLVELLDIKAV